MAVRIPFQYIDALPEPSRTQLWRNFEEIQTALATVTPGGTPGTPEVTFDGINVKGLGVSRIRLHPNGQTVEIGRYLDFHTSGNADEGTPDYAPRLEATSVDILALRPLAGGRWGLFQIGVSPNASMGAYGWDSWWAHFGCNEAFGAADRYAFMSRDNGDILINSWGVNTIRFALTGTEKAAIVDSGGGGSIFKTTAAWIGRGNFYGDFACFSHASRWAAGQYCLMQEWNGTTYLNAYQNHIWLRVNNNNVMEVGTAANRINVYGTDRFGAGHCFRIWDDGEVWCWSVGVGGDNPHNAGIMIHNNWLRMKGTYGVFWEDQDVGFQASSYRFVKVYGSWSVFMAYRFDQIGDWGVSAIRTTADGGGSGARISFHSNGQGAAQIIKNWGSALEFRTWDDGGWAWCTADFNDVSSVRFKKDVRYVDHKAERHKEKVKRIGIIKYKRPLQDDCVNCHGTGLMAHYEGGGFDPKEGEAMAIAALLTGQPSPPCRDCGGTKKKTPERSDQKNYDTGFMSFSAEDMAEEFPEAVFYDQEEQPLAIKPLAVCAILWEQVKDLEERLDAMERVPANQLGKP